MDNRKIILLVGAALFVGLMTGVLGNKFFRGQEPVSRTTSPAMPPEPVAQTAPDYRLKISELKGKLQSNPNDVDLLVQLGNTYFDSNLYPESIEAYEKALAFNPGKANVLTDLGVMYRRNGQPEKAVKSFREAASISPTHSQSRMNLGIVLFYDLKDSAGARAAIEEFLRVTGNSPEADNARALLAEINASMGAQ